MGSGLISLGEHVTGSWTVLPTRVAGDTSVSVSELAARGKSVAGIQQDSLWKHNADL